jgi:serine/threonine protein kinase
VILYVLLTGAAPFNGKNDDQIYASIKKSNYSTDRKTVIKYLIPYIVLKKRKISASAQDLISKMLMKNAEKRLTAA